MQRPTTVTVLGILNIFFGVVGILASLGSLVSFNMQSAGAPTGNPVLDLMTKSPGLAMWTKVSTVLGIFSAIGQMISGVVLLQLLEWGRKLAIGVAFYSVLLTIIGFFANMTLLVRPLLDAASKSSDPAMKAGAFAGAFTGFFGSCGGLIYPAIILFFLTRPEVVAAFRPLLSDSNTPVPPNDQNNIGGQNPPDQPFSGQSF